MAMRYAIQTYSNARYDVIVDGERFETWVTHDPLVVEDWIRGTENRNHARLHRLIVGLDIKWPPSDEEEEDEYEDEDERHPIAILQLFVSTRCLIYQFQGRFPKVLNKFLENPNYTFVGVGIKDHKQKLLWDHSVGLGKTKDLRKMAARELVDPDLDLQNAGLKKLAKVILGKDVDHEEVLKVRRSDWDSNRLSNDQVLYACVNAYLCFDIGRQLQSWYD